jgi:maltooligosyltrehalose trehalohydrolase
MISRAKILTFPHTYPREIALKCSRRKKIMGRLRVWAPSAKEVSTDIRGVRIPLSCSSGGWWEVETPLATHGNDYWIVLDGKKPIPDPRSPWQPYGIEGPSRFLDHSLFSWSDGAWQSPPLSAALIYELHVGTFTPEGTFEGIERSLDHLVDLGVSYIELMPVNGFPGSRGWGYDGVNLYAPHEAYGGPESLKRLLNACHRRGVGVILDVVYNHLGPTGNYLDWFGPYYTGRYKTPWGEAINFDGPGSDEVRRFFCDNALMWMRDYHFDGLRIDAVHTIFDNSALHILEQLASEVHELESQVGRHLFLIAESDLNNPRIIQRPEIGGYGIDVQWNDDFRHSLHTVLTGERNGYHGDFGTLTDLAKVLKEVYVYDGRYSEYRHRRHGRPFRGLSGHPFLGYLQNHDQVGNRALGERSSQLMGPGRLKIAAALILTSPFTPMLFQGEEWGASTPFQYFTDHGDPELGRAVIKGRREEFAAFGWNPEEIPDPQAPETCERSKLKWEEKSVEPHASIMEWHRRLIRLRRSLPALTDGRLDRVRTRFDEEKKWFIMARGPVTVLCNIAVFPQALPLSEKRPRELLLSSEAEIEIRPSSVELLPDSVAILGPYAG